MWTRGTGEPTFTNDRVAQLLAELLDGWARDRGQSQGFWSQAHVALVAPSTRSPRTNTSSGTRPRTCSRRITIEANPLVRAAYEARADRIVDDPHIRRAAGEPEMLPEHIADAVFALTGGDLALTTGCTSPSTRDSVPSMTRAAVRTAIRDSVTVRRYDPDRDQGT